MRHKYVCFLILLLFAGCMTLTGCGKYNNVQKDLKQYMEEGINPIKQYENEAVKAYNDVLLENDNPENLQAVVERHVLPKYEIFVTELEQVKTSTDEVSVLKQQYLQSAQLLLKGWKQLDEGLIKSDVELVDQANQQIQQGREQYTAYQEALEDAAREYHIILTYNTRTKDGEADDGE